MARKPRVFTWSDGFHRYVVAATSRAKALEAWGFDRDLFREGAAQEIQDGPGHDRALASPGEVIEIDVSSGVEAASRKASPKKARAPDNAAGRRKLETLRETLKAEDAAAQAEEDAFEARRHALENERAKAAETRAKARRKLTAEIAALRARLAG